MNTFVLIWAIMTNDPSMSRVPVATHSQEFFSQKTCEAAKISLLAFADKHVVVKAICTPR